MKTLSTSVPDTPFFDIDTAIYEPESPFSDIDAPTGDALNDPHFTPTGATSQEIDQ